MATVLDELLFGFTITRAQDWLRQKFSSYDPVFKGVISIQENKNERAYFEFAQQIGVIRKLQESPSATVNSPLLVVAVKMKKALTERTSRQTQFNFAKRLLQDAVRNPPSSINGFLSQGLFFFYDDNGFFRISLVSGTVERNRFKFNEAKRQSFFVNPKRPNNVAKSRLSESIRTFADLKKAFSVETLTKEFYDRLFNWYQWAMLPSTGLRFPNNLYDQNDDEKYNNEAVIRLITRLMFTWFIRQRGMVPDECFQREGVSALLKDFESESMEQGQYYQAILQNIFFATFNCQPEKRKFRQRGGNESRSNSYNVKTLYRHEKAFKDKVAFPELMKSVPFLNCALFDCLDKVERPEDGGRTLLFDGFSDVLCRQAFVPNGLFFKPAHTIKIANKAVVVCGIIELFDTYEFTIDENNADDADIALDPELIGKVFENLLGAFNPETKETARKSTGSFYTPREIVDYMVEEALKNYLKTKVPELSQEDLSDLFDKRKAAEHADLPFGKEIVAKACEALYTCKILDPACGSGAFPMGVLHCMVRLFGRLDPGNYVLNNRLIERYKKETSAPRDPSEPESERQERLAALEVQLDEGQHYPDYARKLYLIENCIYGVDIQPIATQISKLRFFISLLCDQLRSNWNKKAENHGLLSLPNLEAKFVCANTLIPLPETEGELALATKGILKLRDKLAENRHQIYAARTYFKKEKLKNKDLEIRDQIRDAVRNTLSKPDEKLIAEQAVLIRRLQAERQAYALPKWETVQKSVQGSLFGEVEQREIRFERIDLNQSKRNELDAQIFLAQKKITAERNKDTTSNVTAIDQLATLVAGWDPYDQNASSSFFDPKWMFNITDGFDVVIGNPPYVQVKKGIFSIEKFPYSEGKDKGKQNLYKVFIEASYNFLKSSGISCLIVQSSLMCDLSSIATRELLLSKTMLLQVIEFPKDTDDPELKVFKGVLTGTCICLFKKEENIENSWALSVHNTLSDVFKFNFVYLSQKGILDGGRGLEFPLIKHGASDLYVKMKTAYRAFKEIFTGTKQGNINTIHLSRIHSDGITSIRIGKGDRVHRYQLDNGLMFAKETAETIALAKQNMQGYPVISQNITGQTDKWRIHACRAECKKTRIVFLHSANVAYLPSPRLAKIATGLLNSKLLDWTFRTTSTNNHVNLYELVELPIPNEEVLDGELSDELVALVEKAEAGCDVQTQIDQVVYQLYGLTDEEITLVEGCPIVEENPVTPSPVRPAPPPSVVQPTSKPSIFSTDDDAN